MKTQEGEWVLLVDIRNMWFHPQAIRNVLDLAWSVFRMYNAPDFDAEAIQLFYRDSINSPAYLSAFLTGVNLLYAAFTGDRPIGLIASHGDHHISMLFVDGDHHRRGIGTRLLETMVQDMTARCAVRVTLESAPHALPFYHVVGFWDTEPVQHRNGFVYTPMALELDQGIADQRRRAL